MLALFLNLRVNPLPLCFQFSRSILFEYLSERLTSIFVMRIAYVPYVIVREKREQEMK